MRAAPVDGVYRWFHSRGFPLRDSHGSIVRWYNLLIDIDERKRVETRLAGEIRLLEMVASGASLPDVLNELCRFVEDTATNCHCGIYLIDWNGPTFNHAAAPTLPTSFNDPIEGVPVRAESGRVRGRHVSRHRSSLQTSNRTRYGKDPHFVTLR